MRILIFYLLMLFPFLAFGHGGEDHGAAKPAAPTAALGYFTSIANSDKYELLLKYEPLKGGKDAIMRLYVSNFASNKAISDAVIEVSAADDSNIKFTIKHLETGVYQLTGRFPKNQPYSLNISINSSIGPDLLVLENIEVGKIFPVIESAHNESLFSKNNILLLLAGAALGSLIVLAVFFFRNRRMSPEYATAILALLILPLTTSKISAHGGESHGGTEAAAPSQSGASDTFLVPKDSQFLFDILTTNVSEQDFLGSSNFLGTVLPATNGMAVIQSPQTGKITSLRTSVGQRVSKGQVLAIIEQSIDAGTQVDLLTQKNNAEAEARAAKIQYDRLKSIADIAAKKDVQEAEARYRSAESNLRLLRQLSSGGAGNTKLISLTAPISGIVGSFNYAIGATVNAGETLFSITDLSKVYIEAQIYAKDAGLLSNAKEILASISENPTVKSRLRLISKAQSVNGANQTQKYIFEVNDGGGNFKIGQNVNVLVFSGKASPQLVVPSSAVTEINGKPAVFVKDGPESFTVSYIQKGSNNGTNTSILKGIESGEHIVANGTYQMKTMFLNQ